jgi:hypothetical protein
MLLDTTGGVTVLSLFPLLLRNGKLGLNLERNFHVMISGRLKSCPVVTCLVRRASGYYCHSLSGSFLSVREISDGKKQLFKRLESCRE